MNQQRRKSLCQRVFHFLQRHPVAPGRNPVPGENIQQRVKVDRIDLAGNIFLGNKKDQVFFSDLDFPLHANHHRQSAGGIEALFVGVLETEVFLRDNFGDFVAGAERTYCKE